MERSSKQFILSLYHTRNGNMSNESHEKLSTVHSQALKRSPGSSARDRQGWYIHMYVYIYIYICIHTYIYLYIYVYIYM